MVLGLFQKRAPERLATLREARSAGDVDKVLRVLHTLKPQLVALDPDGVGALCAGLAASGTMPAQSDLDRLESAIEQLVVAR
jgi:HPt (histidine-containing phosphotransfer) domain-containing protein